MVEYKKFLKLFLLILIFSLTACSGGGGDVSPDNGSGGGSISITISSPESSVKIGKTIQLSGAATDGSGKSLDVTGDDFVWSTSNPDIATVDGGTVTGLLTGSIAVKLTYKTFSAEVVILVTKAEIASVEMSPQPLNGDEGFEVFPETTLQLTVTVLDVDGDQVSTVALQWESLDNSIATVSSDGVVTMVSVGTTTIRAFIGEISATVKIIVKAYPVATISVTPGAFTIGINAIQQFNALAHSELGSNILNLAFVWSSSDSEIASVDEEGNVTGISEGDVLISAAFGGVVSNMANLTVSGSRVSGEPDSVVVSPEDATIIIGDSTRLIARILNINGDQLDPVASETDSVNLLWSSADELIATVDSSGLVTGVAVGRVAITATGGTVFASAQITVKTIDITEVTVSPSTTDIDAGSFQQLGAVARNAIGDIVSDTEFIWSSSDSLVAPVSLSGIVTAIGAGGSSATITATSSNGIAGSAIVTIVEIIGSTVEIAITPAAASVAIAESVQFSASVSGADDTTVIWSVDGGNGTISASGLYLAPFLRPAGGQVTVRALAVADLTKTAISQVSILSRFATTTTVVLQDGSPGSLTVADFTGEGVLDLAIVSNTESRITIFEGSGSDFQEGTVVDLGIIGRGSYSLGTADLDLDGKSDIISANSLEDTVSVFYGDGTGAFDLPLNLQFFDFSLPAVAVTLDIFDGTPDIITGNLNLDSLSIMVNNNDRTFFAGMQVALPESAFPFDLATGDMNGDLVDDLVVADLTNDSLYIYHPDPDSGLIAGQTLSLVAGSHPVAVVIDDFDGDGSLDLASANRQSGNVSVFLSTGSALSTTASYYDAGVYPSDIATGDFNHDGILDLATVNRGSDNIGVFFGVGDGTFEEMVGFATGSSPLNIAVADYDSDGDEDDIVTITLDSAVLFLN